MPAEVLPTFCPVELAEDPSVPTTPVVVAEEPALDDEDEPDVNPARVPPLVPDVEPREVVVPVAVTLVAKPAVAPASGPSPLA